MEAVVAAMKSGWRRPGRNIGLDGDLVRLDSRFSKKGLDCTELVIRLPPPRSADDFAPAAATASTATW